MTQGTATQKQINYILGLSRRAGLDRKGFLEWLEFEADVRLGYGLAITSLDELDHEDCNPIIKALERLIEERQRQ